MPTANPFVGSQAERRLTRQRRRAGPIRYTPPPPPVITPTVPGSLCIRGVYGFLGISAGAPDGVYWAQPSFHYETDSQYIAAVLGDEGGNSGVKTVLYFHCDNSFTNGAYLAISFLGVTLGSFTRSATSGVITYYPFDGASLSMLLVAGQIVGVQNVGTAYNILVNGHSVLTFTGGSVPTGPSFRSAFVSMNRLTDSRPFVWDSYRIAALSLADYVQPVYTGTGARISRHSTANTNGTSGAAGTRVLETGLYDSIDIATANIVPNLGDGSFSVATPGWYRVTARHQTPDNISTSGTVSSIIRLVLYKNGALVQYGMDVMAGYLGGGGSGGTVFIKPSSLWASFDVSLDPNDIIQIGVNVVGGALFTSAGGAGMISATGDSIGGKTFTDIALLNPRSA